MIFTSEALSNALHIFKNNLWYSDNNTNSIEFKGTAVSVPEFQSGVGEIDGLSVNPMFTNTTAGSEDFTLQSSSPAIGNGYKAVDMGAYALYGKSIMGCDTNLQITQPLSTNQRFQKAIQKSHHLPKYLPEILHQPEHKHLCMFLFQTNS